MHWPTRQPPHLRTNEHFKTTTQSPFPYHPAYPAETQERRLLFGQQTKEGTLSSEVLGIAGTPGDEMQGKDRRQYLQRT